MSFGSASSTPILLAEFAPANESREYWPVRLAAERTSGATAIVAAIPWGYSPTAIVDLAHLCDRLGMALAFDLRCLSTPPPDLLRANPGAVSRDADGRPMLTSAGELQAELLHPALRDLARQWLLNVAVALRAVPFATQTLTGYFCDGPNPVIEELQRWQQADSWPAPLYVLPQMLGAAHGWPFSQSLLRLAPSFRPSANQRALAMLARLAGSDLATAQIPEVAEGMHIAWADAPGVAIQVRHSAITSYLTIERQSTEAYSGVLTYRNADGELLHLHVNIGPARHGIVLLHDEEIAGAAFDGDASEGVWLVRAMQSSVVFNGGNGAIVPCGSGILLLANQSGRFQIRRPIAWEGASVFRLLTSGALLPVPCQIESAHLTVPYIAADSAGVTDFYTLIVDHIALAEPLHSSLSTILLARAEVLLSAQIAQLESVARQLQELAASLTSIGEYRALWDAQLATSAQARVSLQQRLSEVRATRLLMGDAPASDEEHWLVRVLAIL